MRTENIRVLIEGFPLLRSQLSEHELNSATLRLEESRSGEQTLAVVSEDSETYLHSKYDPVREADTIINQYRDKLENGTTHVVFYGLGLGYHIAAFCKEFPRTAFSIIEPVPEVLDCYLKHRDLGDLSIKALKHLVLGDSEQKIREFIEDLFRLDTTNIVVIELPSHIRAFSEQHIRWSRLFQMLTKSKIGSIRTNFAYQKRWLINSMINFKEVLRTPNILHEARGEFDGIPALLVAAGPSLDDEIENIRSIKENGLAYIFSVGSAINTLLHHGITPDAACTYDPTVKNSVVFEKVVQEGISEIPMIFGSSVGFETLRNYPGPKLHMITSQDSVGSFFLSLNSGEELLKVSDAPSIAVVTLQLLHQLGVSPIVLVGQNLAYREKGYYASGISYQNSGVNASQLDKAVVVKDVYGTDILTNETFNRMRMAMEAFISAVGGSDVINTTKGGARIEGTQYMELEKVINERLGKRVVNEDMFRDLTPTDYDLEYLEKQFHIMVEEYQQLPMSFSEVRRVLRTIESLAQNQNYPQVERMYSKLDESWSRVTKNQCYQVVLLPMNRVHNDAFVNKVTGIKEQKNPMAKVDGVLDAYRRYVQICAKDLEQIDLVMTDLQEAIEHKLSYQSSL